MHIQNILCNVRWGKILASCLDQNNDINQSTEISFHIHFVLCMSISIRMKNNKFHCHCGEGNGGLVVKWFRQHYIFIVDMGTNNNLQEGGIRKTTQNSERILI